MTMNTDVVAALIVSRDGWEEIEPDGEVRRFRYGDLTVRLVWHEKDRHWHLWNDDGRDPSLPPPPDATIVHPPDPVVVNEKLKELEDWHDSLDEL